LVYPSAFLFTIFKAENENKVTEQCPCWVVYMYLFLFLFIIKEKKKKKKKKRENAGIFIKALC
jgi:preprotein translocase subunit YajC